MSIGVSSLRPMQDLSTPTDFSSLSGKSGQHNTGQNPLSGGGSGNQAIDPSTLLFASPAQQSQVNFAPPNSQDPQVNASDPQSGTDSQSMVQQIMSLLMQLMQMLMQGNTNQPNAQNLAAQNGGGGGGGGGSVDSGGGGGDGGGGAVDGGGSGTTSAATPTSNAASGVTDDTALSGSGDLHLPQQLEPYRNDIMDASQATGVPANILAGQIWAESRGQLGQDTTNVNGTTDAGLMPVNADTFAGLKKENPDLLGNADVNNAHDNIMAGALYMRDQHQAFGDWGSALRAYNSGPDKVSSDLSNAGGVGDPDYVNNVLNFAKTIESGQGQLPA